MARKTARPIIFPLSNPTEHSEATAADLIHWTGGRALVASGSPFDAVPFDGRMIPIAQCNNVYIFPAVGLGLVASRARRLTDAMMQAAARALAEHSPALEDPGNPLLPPLHDLRRVAVEIAMAVGLEAQRAGLAPLTTSETLRDTVNAARWNPEYPQL
jgi:malate dehydrogenase (oxaloacetate-decarboxylating)